MAEKASSPSSSSSSLSDDVLILDGGTGREIERRGGPFRTPEWSALALYEAPGLVRRVHESFLSAGARAVTTNTYAVVPFHLGPQRYAADGKRLLRLAVDLARQARQNFLRQRPPRDDDDDDKVFVLGSIPPVCGSYEWDKFDESVAGPVVDDFLEAFGGGDDDHKVDVILLETMGSVREAVFYLRAIQKAQLNLPVWLSFCLKREYGHGKPPTVLTGESLRDAIAAMDDWLLTKKTCPEIGAATTTTTADGQVSQSLPKVTTVMVNCCDVRLVTQAIAELRASLDPSVRVGAFPNAFSIPPPDSVNQTLRKVDYNIDPDYVGRLTPDWLAAGATVLGGCCGVGPQHICAMKALARPKTTTTTTPAPSSSAK